MTEEEKLRMKKPQLKIEIRKGRNIYNTSGCTNSKSYVSCNVIPLNQLFKTATAKAIIPKWFQLFTFNGEQRSDFQIIQIKLINEDNGKETLLGNIERELQQIGEKVAFG